MKRTQFSVLLLIAATLPGAHTAGAQVINATMQNASARVVTRAAPAAKPIANTAIGPHVAPRPASFTPRSFNSYVPRAAGQSVPNAGRNSPYIVRSLNPTVVPISTQRNARIGGQQTITIDPATRQTELRTLAAMRERRGLVTGQVNTLDPATRQTELRTLAAMRERRVFGTNAQTVARLDAQRQVTTHDPEAGAQPDRRESPKDVQGKKGHNKKDHISFNDAFRRHWHEWHDRNWWHDHCDTIIFVSTGYYFLDGSYWYPAWGYDPLQTYYDYDGPIYTYSDLLPDEVIANVQTALQNAGYYYGPITGSLSVDTRAAIANFQRDYGLPITGAIDEATVEALGLYQPDAYQSGDVLDSSY
jgi:Putative peptidoglycan binding domain